MPRKYDDDEKPRFKPSFNYQAVTVVCKLILPDDSEHVLTYTRDNVGYHRMDVKFDKPRKVMFDNGEFLSDGHHTASMDYQTVRSDMLNYLRRLGHFRVRIEAVVR